MRVPVRTALCSFVDHLFTHDLLCEGTLFEATKSIIKVLGFKASLRRQIVDLQGLAESLCSALQQNKTKKMDQSRKKKKKMSAAPT